MLSPKDLLAPQKNNALVRCLVISEELLEDFLVCDSCPIGDKGFRSLVQVKVNCQKFQDNDDAFHLYTSVFAIRAFFGISVVMIVFHDVVGENTRVIARLVLLA